MKGKQYSKPKTSNKQVYRVGDKMNKQDILDMVNSGMFSSARKLELFCHDWNISVSDTLDLIKRYDELYNPNFWK